MSRLLSVVAWGQPVPQGSMKGFVVKGRAGAPHRAVLTHGGDTLAPWRSEVSWAARQALAGDAPLLGPLAVTAVFTLRKPASAPKRRPTWPDRRPDLDKLLRAVLDSLTDAGVWHDDAQVIHVTASKTYPGATPGALDRPGVRITVEEWHP